MPLALIRLPRRRSIVSSMPSTTGPVGAKASSSRPSRMREPARGLQITRWSNRPMVVGEPPFPAEPGDPQEAGHSAPAGREDGADQQQLGMAPYPLLHEHRREG